MASQSMADYLKTAGWLVLVGWCLSPIFSLLANKFFAYLFSDVSRKFRNLETNTVLDLEQTLRNVHEQRMRRSFEDTKESLSVVVTLEKIEQDLKSALDEAEYIIMDTVDYHRAEEEAVGHASSWVQQRLAAACTCIALCFRRSWVWLQPWIDVTRARAAALRPCALRLYQVGRSIIHGLLFKMHSIIHITRALLRQCAQSICRQHLGEFVRGATPHTKGALLPVSVVKTSVSGSGGSMVGPGTLSSTSTTALEATTMDAAGELGSPKPPQQRQADMVVEEEKEHEKVEEIEEEKVVEEEEKVKNDEEQENVEEEEKVKEEQQQVEEIEEKVDEEKVKKEEKREENRALYRRRVQQYFQSVLIYLTKAIAFARSYRDWSYQEAFGSESNQRGCIAVYSLFPAFGTNSLGKRIKRIENILNDSKKSHLLNQKSSSSEIPNKDSTNNERSSSEIPSKEDTKKESSSSSRQEQIDHLYRKIERKVFGRDEVLKVICGMFRKRSDAYGTTSSSSSKLPYSVFGIHGITGSGKTTLANLICEHEKMSKDKHFDVIMFSHVSLTFRVEKIFGDMLKDITGVQPGNEDIERLRNELKEKLKGRRFLLVLDDLWVKRENQKEREILLNALRDGKNGSIILVTAQRKDAAVTLGAQEKEQMLIPDLKEEEYLTLFMHHALQGTVDDDGRFEMAGRIIAKKLRSSPIAAVTVGRRLQAEKNIDFWKNTANAEELKETMGALWWSYQQLGVDTRRCFQYCSTFPKGYILERYNLVRMWIAQGFVNAAGSNETEELEDVGMRYFQELLQFSFLQVRNTWDTEEFTIHDLLHDLAKSVAGSDIFRIDDLSVLPAKDNPPCVRHLFIGSKNAAQDAQTAAEKNLGLGNLRTLVIDEMYSRSTNGEQRRHDLEIIFDRLFRRLRKLRVLIIRLGSNPGELSLAASIDQMKHLRYFGFDCPSDFGAKLILPSTFSKLYQMQTIFFERGDVSYPEGMTNLIRLRHIGGCLFGFPNVGRMTSLQTMDGYFHVRKERGYELKQLEQLNKLRGHLEIYGLANVGSKEEAIKADLARKKRVTELTLCFGSSWGSRTSNRPDMEAEILEGLCPPKDLQALTIEGYRGSRYPSWMLSGQKHPDAPKHLRRLELTNCSCPLASFPEDSELFMSLRGLKISYCEWDSLPENMERLVSLQSLEIVEYQQNKIVLGPTLPRSLRKICIHRSNLVLENMEELVSLESLLISCCDKMEVLPTLPRSLKIITIDHCDVLSRTCQEEGHKN